MGIRRKVRPRQYGVTISFRFSYDPCVAPNGDITYYSSHASPSAMKTTRALRKKLDNWKQKPIVAPGVHDPYCARIAEKLGFDTLYMGGAATSMSRLGMADFGLATATEVQANAKYITSVTRLPLIADSDNGYGNA